MSSTSRRENASPTPFPLAHPRREPNGSRGRLREATQYSGIYAREGLAEQKRRKARRKGESPRGAEIIPDKARTEALARHKRRKARRKGESSRGAEIIPDKARTEALAEHKRREPRRKGLRAPTAYIDIRRGGRTPRQRSITPFMPARVTPFAVKSMLSSTCAGKARQKGGA